MADDRGPSARFNRAKLRGMARVQVQQQRNVFEPRRTEQLGTYLGANEVVVNGKRYRFRDTQNINPQPGQQLTVRNVGRRAVAIYAPSEGTEVR